ncbi:iron-siderophore ABC transporter substrate-binding protein [Stutzerimonas nosocomialis]|uniref:Iron-siderophore ABC transporter substrate-binding protein n=1 Tax=Stutzerimonas nosocomialis TaxID=1056496 RepID=A0A5R9QAZ7_9GAMM|nr:ABC transporter substrate-binding protein [Stutzerimonas nosocomialis]TLX62271.1 iron-siderophore ABC transporter substrate-binding protein [Stutzerimonas nosocomialis]
MKAWLTLSFLLLILIGAPVRADDPPRIAALSWEPIEHLLMLGVTPVAVADSADYRAWVVRPTLPDSLIDVSTRTEPNLELLAQLDLDLIVITPLLEDLRDKLERIAPVVAYGDFTQARDNHQMQRENYLALAARIGRLDRARETLEAMDARLDDLRAQLHAHFGKRLPNVTVVRFSTPTAVLVYGPNSMPWHALDLLGLGSAYDTPASRWGNLQLPVTVLSGIDEGVVLHIEPFPAGERLFNSQLWQGMPVVRGGRFAGMRPAWTHGGVFCVQFLAEAITEALLKIPTTAVEP